MKPNKHPETIDLSLRETNYILSDHVIDMLKAKPGDRIVIGYIDLNGNLTPVISIGEAGNKLAGTNNVSFRGKQREILAQFGTNFWASENDGMIVLEGDGIPVYTEVKKAAQAYISKEIILDINYNITKLENYEF